MKPLRLFFLRSLGTLLILLLILTVAIGWLGSSRLLTPERRPLQDYHRDILDAPADFGRTISEHEARCGTPYLIVRPTPSPGIARKSRALREALKSTPTPASPWGQIQGTVVLLHGHSSRKEDHLPICERLCAAGFRCILPDLPGHGDSPLDHATFGMSEAALIEDLVNEVQESTRSTPTFLFGISQGGAISILTAARNPDQWAGVVSVAAFSSLDEVIHHSARSIHPMARSASPLCYHAVAMASRVRSGMDPARIRPADAARQLTLPALIAHGDADTYIPIAQGRSIFDKIPSSEKQFYTVEGGNHGRVLAVDADRLYPAICSFMLASLPD